MNEKFIKKELNLTIQGNVSTLDEALYLYRHDKNIDIYITISNLKFDFLTGITQSEDLIYTSNAQYFSLRILKPNKEEFSTSRMPTINNRVGFSIERDFIDAFDEVGIYQLQISLHGDIDGESRITIPPVNFEVCSHIFGDKEEILGEYDEEVYFAKTIDENKSEDDEEIKASIMDETKVIKSSLVHEQYDNRMEQKIGTGLYEWQDGDYIASARMNSIHRFILNLDENITKAQNEIKVIPTIQSNISNLQADITNIRNSLNKNIEAKDVLYTTYEEFVNVQQALDYLLYKPVEITSFTCNAVSTIREYGNYFQNVTFYWQYNKNITSHSFYGEVLPSLSLREYLYKPAFNTERTFTLEATDGKTTVQKSITFHFYKRIYWGTSQLSSYSTSLINELQSSELLDNHKSSITVNAEQRQYIYYIVPMEFRSCEFSVNGFIGGISLVATNVEYINGYGRSIRYNVYRSDNHSLGNTTINIL